MSATPRPVIDARGLVEGILDSALRHRASDVHVEPTAQGYEVKARIDGLLEPAGSLDAAAGRAVVARLMVLASLLTYRLDIPQEGKISLPPAQPSPGAGAPTVQGRGIELRLAVMPTTHGLRAAVRLPAEFEQPRRMEELDLPAAVLDGLREFAQADAGMLLLTGPAGSGKTTTIYALLRHITETSPGVSVVALEDPVERDLPGVTQIQVQPFGELTYERALRSMLRQDPQVLMLGEIRDAATASIAIQAALSGHRLISTLHAADPGSAIARLLEMGIEPYQITSAARAIVTQRLLRRRAAGAPSGHARAADSIQGSASSVQVAPTAPAYLGRVPVAEIAHMGDELRRGVLERLDAKNLQSLLHRQPRYVTLDSAAYELAARGVTDEAEVVRVLGPRAADS